MGLRNHTICLDFDGVLHSYISGWQGIDTVADAPVPGAQYAVKELIEKGYKIVVCSTRFCNRDSTGDNAVYDKPDEVVMDSSRGMAAVEKWLSFHGFPDQIELAATKPPASLYVDDRGFRFEGCFDDLLDFVQEDPELPSWVPRVVRN